jgi:riboflavin transporter FmnP
MRMRARNQRVSRFLFPAESDMWVTFLRVGLGVQTTLYSLSLRYDWNYLFSGSDSGLISRDLAEKILSIDSSAIPRLGWLIALGARVGLGEETVLSIAWICLLCAGCGLLLGVFSRSFAILAWFLHLCAAKSGAFVSYGVDDFMTIGLFYLMLSPLPDRFAFDQRWRNFGLKDRQLLGFWRRLLQLHLCFIYFFSGLTKCLGSGWWDGSNLWRALVRPPFNVIAPETLVRWKYLFPMAGVFVALLEVSYPFFVWGSRTRNIWLISICLMHLAIGLSMGMYLFALVMIILNLAAFTPAVPQLSALIDSTRDDSGSQRFFDSTRNDTGLADRAL